MDDFWRELGITPTPFKSEIKRAYIAKLKLCNPEVDPAGFMRLRAAYETALTISGQKNAGGLGSAGPMTPPGDAKEGGPTENEQTAPSIAEFASQSIDPVASIERLKQQLGNLYGRVPEHWRVESWKALLSSEIFSDAGFGREAAGHVIRFLVAHPIVPPEIFPMVENLSNFRAEFAFWTNAVGEDVARRFYSLTQGAHLRLGCHSLISASIVDGAWADYANLRYEIECRFIFGDEKLDTLKPLLDKARLLCATDYELIVFYARLLWFNGLFYESLALYKLIDEGAGSELCAEAELYQFEIHHRFGHPEASIWCDAVLRRDPENVHALKYRSIQLIRAGHNEAAIALLGETSRKNPVDFELRTLRTSAICDLIQALEKSRDGHVQRLSMLYELNRYSHVLDLYQNSALILDAYDRLPVIKSYAKLNMEGEACTHIDSMMAEIYQRNLNDFQAIQEVVLVCHQWLSLGWIQGCAVPALPQLTQSTRDAESFLAAALICHHCANDECSEESQEWRDKSTGYIQQAIFRDPSDEWINFYGAFLFWKDHRYELALQCSQQCQSIYYGNIGFVERMADSLLNLGRFEEAAENYQRAITMTTKPEDLLDYYGQLIFIFEKIGLEEAAEKFRGLRNSLDLEVV